MEFGINSSLDLYKRLLPAINCKLNELKKYNMDYIKREDIWNYLKNNKWDKEKGITLAEMVDDILNLDNMKLDSYAKNKLKNIEEKIEVEIL